MQFSNIIFTTLLAAFVTATPARLDTRQFGLCSSALDSALCCDVSIAGVANLNCASPSPAPSNVTDFESVCEAQGQSAYCCTLPVAGEALLCTAV